MCIRCEEKDDIIRSFQAEMFTLKKDIEPIYALYFAKNPTNKINDEKIKSREIDTAAVVRNIIKEYNNMKKQLRMKW